MDGKREQASIRELRSSQIDPFTEHCQIAIERAIIERTQFNVYRAGILHIHGRATSEA